MEKEVFFTGYCRQIDASRMVEVVLENGELTEVDCEFQTCVYRPNCPIARQIQEAIQN